MSNSPASPGPDLFFAGGECLDRFGVWLRRTDMDLEAATREDATRNSDATAIGRDGILRTWQPDTPRADWLNEVDLEATRNLWENNRFEAYSVVNSVIISPGAANAPGGGAVISEDNQAGVGGRTELLRNGIVEAGDVVTATIYVRRSSEADAPTACFRFAFEGGASQTFQLLYDPLADDVAVEGAPPDSTGFEKVGGVWRKMTITATVDGTGNTDIRMGLFPAWRVSGFGPFENAAVGVRQWSGAQAEFGTVSTLTQEMPRDDDREFSSLFLEDAATNLLLFSEEINDAAWNKFGSTIAINTQIAPDGTSSGDAMVESALDETHGMRQDINGLADDQGVILSFYLKAGGRTWCRIVTVDKAGSIVSSWFDLASGRFGTVNHGQETVRALPNNWFRVSIKFNASSGGSQPNAEVQIALSDGTGAYLGNGASGINFWGLMAEEAGSPSSYVATGGVTATRERDLFKAPYPHSPQAMTLYFKWLESGGFLQGQDSKRLFFLGDEVGGGATFMRCFSSGTGNAVRVDYFDGDATSTASSVGGLIVFGDLGELIVNLDIGLLRNQLTLNGEERSDVIADPAPTKFPSQWGSGLPILILNSTQNGVNAGFQRYLAAKVHRGVRSLDFMRAL